MCADTGCLQADLSSLLDDACAMDADLHRLDGEVCAETDFFVGDGNSSCLHNTGAAITAPASSNATSNSAKLL